jgi:hypothetical protein
LCIGAGETRTGAGAAAAPAGCLAAAAILAAKSLECGFFFMGLADPVILRWYGITIPRLRDIAMVRCYRCTASQHFAIVALQ